MFRRPYVHFTPPVGWLNDPNGLIYANETFHLYYQHFPGGTSWGPMHWGHATSTDLVVWSHRPIALAPNENGLIFSGSAVVDSRDTAGFGAGALVAAFTYHGAEGEKQGIAWSHDNGESFTTIDEPILEPPAGEPDFRDPKVFWFQQSSDRETKASEGHWVMLLAVGQSIWIYTSPDLKMWTRTDAVADVFSTDGTWEMPELFRFEDGDVDVWVLVASIGDGAPGGGCGVQGVAGRFDGATFTPTDDAFWVDHGSAFYAAQAWNDAPDHRHIWVGWMGNWRTANDLPAGDWRGQMSVAREVALAKTDLGYRLVQTPVPELANCREGSAASGAVVGEGTNEASVTAAAIDVSLMVGRGNKGAIDCRRAGQNVAIRADAVLGQLLVTVTSESGEPTTYEATHEPVEDQLEIRAILDVASVEVFAGTATISLLLANIDDPWSATATGDHAAAVPLTRGDQDSRDGAVTEPR